MDKRPVFGEQTIDNLMKHGVVLCGSPKTVREQLEHNAKEWGFDTHIGVFHFGETRDRLELNGRRSLRAMAKMTRPAVACKAVIAPSTAIPTQTRSMSPTVLSPSVFNRKRSSAT